MDFFEVTARRHSVRAFKTAVVEDEKIERILKTVNSAPSAGDLQAYRVYLVRSRDTLRALARAAFDQFFIADAPLALVFCAVPSLSAIKYRQRGRQLYALQDATIAAAYAQLSATALGLGSVWVGALDEDEVQKAIGAEEDEVPIAILPIGYPAEVPAPTPRRSLKDLVREV